MLIGGDEHEMTAFTPDQEKAAASWGKMGTACCGQGAPELRLSKGEAWGPPGAPITLTSLAGRKTEKSVGFI